MRIIKSMKYPKLIVWWHGTDAIRLVSKVPSRWYYKVFFLPFYRLFWKIAWRFFDKHYVHDIYKKRALLEFGIDEKLIEVKHTGKISKKCSKIAHKGFNILFYLPSNNSVHRDWTYGKDYLDELQKRLGSRVNWIIANGKLDMLFVYPYIDFYIKINKTVYNGLGRIAEECLENNIPICEVHSYRGCFSDHIKSIVKYVEKILDDKDFEIKTLIAFPDFVI